MKLICLPYAGGSASSLSHYLSLTDQSIQKCLYELPGRGRRLKEPLIEEFDTLLNLIIEEIRSIIEEEEQYAIMGYSMGSLIAYELYYKITEAGLAIPKHIFFCASRTPDAYEEFKKAKLDDDSIIAGIETLGSLTKDILSNARIRNKFLPVIRADYKAIMSYSYKNNRPLLQCNISAVCGDRDEQNIGTIHRWREFSSADCSTIVTTGGHFFAETHIDFLCEHVNHVLSKYIKTDNS